MTTLETLKAARKLITPKERWTQGCAARDLNRETVPPDDPSAVCWCAYGSIWHFEGYNSDEIEYALESVVEDGDVATFNDTHTHTEVLRAFDEAIARLEAA